MTHRKTNGWRAESVRYRQDRVYRHKIDIFPPKQRLDCNHRLPTLPVGERMSRRYQYQYLAGARGK